MDLMAYILSWYIIERLDLSSYNSISLCFHTSPLYLLSFTKFSNLLPSHFSMLKPTSLRDSASKLIMCETFSGLDDTTKIHLANIHSCNVHKLWNTESVVTTSISSKFPLMTFFKAINVLQHTNNNILLHPKYTLSIVAICIFLTL